MKRQMIKFLSLSLMLCLFFITNSFANPTLKTITKEVQGQGETENLAVSNAIINGITQENGTYVNSVNAVINAYTQGEGEISIGPLTLPLSGNMLAQENISAIKAATKGSVVSYKLLKSSQKDKQWFVTLEMTFAKYSGIKQSKEKQNQYSLTVLPFKLNTLVSPSAQYSVHAVSLLSQTITDNLSQSNDFRMVDRNIHDLNAYKNEINILQSGNVTSLEQGRLGQMIGSDYIVTGTVNLLRVENISKDYYGTNFNHYIAQMTVNYRLIEMATMQLRYSDTISVSIPQEEITQLLQNPDNNLSVVEQMLVEKAGNQISQAILQHIEK